MQKTQRNCRALFCFIYKNDDFNLASLFNFVDGIKKKRILPYVLVFFGFFIEFFGFLVEIARKSQTYL